ncbi:ankyrin repeat domain-containing protein [Candidatus Babeliales bacterium]|nr:ankyrin repeat domain-containing protein [Candidatus Babeliales bacterium]
MKTGGLHTPEKCARVTEMINTGVLVNQSDSSGNTALHIACCQVCTLCIQELLAHGADRTIKNNYNETPLELVTRRLKESSRFRRPVTPEQLEACKILLESLS